MVGYNFNPHADPEEIKLSIDLLKENKIKGLDIYDDEISNHWYADNRIHYDCTIGGHIILCSWTRDRIETFTTFACTSCGEFITEDSTIQRGDTIARTSRATPL